MNTKRYQRLPNSKANHHSKNIWCVFPFFEFFTQSQNHPVRNNQAEYEDNDVL